MNLEDILPFDSLDIQLDNNITSIINNIYKNKKDEEKKDEKYIEEKIFYNENINLDENCDFDIVEKENEDIYSPFMDNSVRIEKIKKIIKTNSNNEIEQIFSDFCINLNFTNMSIFRDFLKECIKNVDMNKNIKLNVAYQLTLSEHNKNEGFNILLSCIENISKNLNENKNTENVMVRMFINDIFYTISFYNTNTNEFKRIIKCFYLIFSSNNYTVDTIRNTFLDMFNKLKHTDFKNILNKVVSLILSNPNINTNIKIYTLQRCIQEIQLLTNEDKIPFIKEILKISQNKNENDNIKGLCADIFLNLNDFQIHPFLTNNGYEKWSDVGYFILRQISKDAKFYDNTQNIHETNIVESAIKILNDIKSKVNNVKNLDYYFDKFKEYKNLKDVYLRLTEDKTFFVKLNSNLSNIFCVVCEYIDKNENKEELMKRLIEECIDMSDTCSTGYINRLANVFSGFEEYKITMSVKSELKALFFHLMNNRISQSENVDDVIDDLSNINYESKYYNDFIIENFISIKEECFEHYKKLLTLEQFEEIMFEIYKEYIK